MFSGCAKKPDTVWPIELVAHVVELLKIEEPLERSFYEKQMIR
jgi:hypothetical protein